MHCEALLTVGPKVTIIMRQGSACNVYAYLPMIIFRLCEFVFVFYKAENISVYRAAIHSAVDIIISYKRGLR